MRIFLPGPCGDLEADLGLPSDEPSPRAVCAIGHAHPLHGGTMHTTAVYRLAKGLREAGAAALRVHFRGVGASAGKHDGRGGEEEDLSAGLDALERRYPRAEAWLAGFSFGARTAGSLAARASRVRRVVLVALPVLVSDCDFLRELSCPGLLVGAGRDHFGNLRDLRARYPDLPAAIEGVEIPQADHFFARQSGQLQEIVRAYAARALEP
jgi:hypothetical protein